MGPIGNRHADCYRAIAGCELVGVCDRLAERADAASARSGVPAFYDAAEMLAQVQPDLCSVTTGGYEYGSDHYEPTMQALEAGFHVVCDKPMTLSLAEAKKLEKKVAQSGRLFCLTHNYTGYPMVKEARDLARGGKLGKIRRVVVEYPQGWLASRLESSGQKQAGWRTDPKRAGASCCMGDIGSHCENLAEYITGLKITEMCAQLNTFVPGRPLDDDGSVLLKFDSGATGILWASQVAVGRENDLNIRVFGEKGYMNEMNYQGTLKELPDLARPALPPSVDAGGHGGSHGPLMNEFVTAILQDRDPMVNVYEALAMTVPGIIAHQSALKDGETLKVPQFDRT